MKSFLRQSRNVFVRKGVGQIWNGLAATVRTVSAKPNESARTLRAKPKKNYKNRFEKEFLRLTRLMLRLA